MEQNVALKGMVGSQAYGLDTPDSDEDFLGIYIARTLDLCDLSPGPQSVVTKNPDTTMHEIGRFCQLATKGNPTVLELLFLDKYIVKSEQGERLVENRHLFLSNNVYKTYGGYAKQQMLRLQKRGDFDPGMQKRREKHARHLCRLIIQCKQLVKTGEIKVRLADPDRVRAVGRLPDDELLDWFNRAIADLDATPSILPDEPDLVRINNILRHIRGEHVGYRSGIYH